MSLARPAPSTLSLSPASLPCSPSCLSCFTDTPPTESYTLSLHDALPISREAHRLTLRDRRDGIRHHRTVGRRHLHTRRSEEHTSELQSLTNLVCRLLLEKKNTAAAQARGGRHRGRSGSPRAALRGPCAPA